MQKYLISASVTPGYTEKCVGVDSEQRRCMSRNFLRSGSLLLPAKALARVYKLLNTTLSTILWQYCRKLESRQHEFLIIKQLKDGLAATAVGK